MKTKKRKNGKSNIKKNKDNKRQYRKSKVSKKTTKSKSQKTKKSPSKKRKEIKYENFLVTFTALRSYEYNRPSELEVFTRSIPVYPSETLANFRKKYLAWVIQEEMNTFNKITEDTEGKVMWSNWIYEVKAGEEEF